MCEVAVGDAKEFHSQSYYMTDPVPGYHSSHGVRGHGSVFTEDEWVVYRTNRQRQTYLVEFQDVNDKMQPRVTTTLTTSRNLGSVARLGSVPSTPAGPLSRIHPIPEPLHGIYDEVAMLASHHGGDTRGLELIIQHCLFLLQKVETTGDTWVVQTELRSNLLGK